MRFFSKKLAIAMMFILLLLTLSGTAFAEDTAIRSLDITVSLNQDGSADILQVWNVDNINDGTEYYYAVENVENVTVSDLTVRDDSGGEYTTLDGWDPDASFDDKSYKCGILETEDGYELCWGISRMGDRVFTVSYTMTGLVKAYEDADGFYYRFVSPEFSTPPESATVSIYMDGIEFSRDNAQIWAFGFDGEIQFERGAIVARTDSELGSDDFVNILCGFGTGLFDAVPAEGSFEAVRDRAIDGDDLTDTEIILILLVLVGVILIIVLIIYLSTRNIRLSDGSKARRISKKKLEANTSIPFKGSIPMTSSAWTLYQIIGFTSRPIAAYLTRWELNGAIRFENDDRGGKKKGKPVIILTGVEPETDVPGKELFALLKRASTEGVLQLSAWQKWTEKHEKLLSGWNEDMEEYAKEQLIRGGFVAEKKKNRIQFTPMGYEKALQMMGFHKYLSGFSSKNTDTALPREYWGEYLVFASLFGMSENVAKRFKEADPEGFDQFSHDHGIDPMLFIYFMAYSNTFSDTAAPSGEGGSGGAAASGGGGGFSGGGGGGGR